MKLIKADGPKTCLGCAVAMVTNSSLEELEDFCEHKGENGFNIVEATRYALSRGYALVSFYFPSAYANSEEAPSIPMSQVVAGEAGIIGFLKPSGLYHAVATDGNMVYDPSGHIYPLERFLERAEISVFLVARRILPLDNSVS